jgi:hypothetical protein
MLNKDLLYKSATPVKPNSITYVWLQKIFHNLPKYFLFYACYFTS